MPRVNVLQGVTVHQPRFVALPQGFKAVEPALLALACAPALVALRRRFRFDLLDAGAAWPDGVAIAAIGALIGVPCVISVGGDDMTIFEQDPIRRLLIRWALRRSALIVTHSRKLQRRVVALGVPESRMAVIPDGVDLERFRPLDRETTRACLGIPSSTHLILTEGRLYRPNGLGTLIDALGRLAQNDPELRLVILGNPDPGSDATPEIRAAVIRSALQGRVTVVGGRSPGELAWWYNAADLVCLATTGHESSHALFEAMACGIPCVTDVAREEEMVTDEPFGVLTAADSASVAHAIDEALRRRWDREGIARQARSRGWEAVGREWRARLEAIGQS